MKLVADAQLLWTACAGVVRQHVSEGVWLSSFAGVAARSLDDDRLVLAAPSAWVKDRLENRYQNVVQGALADVG